MGKMVNLGGTEEMEKRENVVPQVQKVKREKLECLVLTGKKESRQKWKMFKENKEIKECVVLMVILVPVERTVKKGKEGCLDSMAWTVQRELAVHLVYLDVAQGDVLGLKGKEVLTEKMVVQARKVHQAPLV